MKELGTEQLCKGKKVVLFAVPGAFTPTCSMKHLPGFIEKAEEIKVCVGGCVRGGGESGSSALGGTSRGAHLACFINRGTSQPHKRASQPLLLCCAVLPPVRCRLQAKGVDTIACISVNDAFVMEAWGKSVGAGDKVLMLADGNGQFAKALGVELDLNDKGLGVRSRRYALLADDQVG